MSPFHCQSIVSPLALAAGVTLLLGCAAAPAVDPGSPVAAPPASRASLGNFLAHISPHDRSVTFHRIQHHGGVPGLSPQDLDNDGDVLSIDNDGADGSGSVDTIELVTNSVGDSFAGDVYGTTCLGADQFCASVTLRSFYPHSLSNVFVQVTAIQDATGAGLPDHDAVNSESSALGLDNTHGLWQYTGSGVDASGVLGQDSPYNAGTQTWSFANPDDADTWIVLSVFAGLSYTSYEFASASTSFIDVCATGSSTTSASASQTMPFGFGLWDTLSSTVNFDKRGVVTFGATGGTATGDNVCLPDGAAPAPALFVFWDDLTFGGSGQMCWATIGSAPNRQFVIEWSDLDFASDDEGSSDVGSSLTFEAILSEGTNTIDVVYDAMIAPDGSGSTRPSGTSATVGTQDSGAISGPGMCDGSAFGSGSAYRFDPSP